MFKFVALSTLSYHLLALFSCCFMSYIFTSFIILSQLLSPSSLSRNCHCPRICHTRSLLSVICISFHRQSNNICPNCTTSVVTLVTLHQLVTILSLFLLLHTDIVITFVTFATFSCHILAVICRFVSNILSTLSHFLNLASFCHHIYCHITDIVRYVMLYHSLVVACITLHRQSNHICPDNHDSHQSTDAVL